MGKTKAPVVLICFSGLFANCGGKGAPGTSDQSAQKDVAVVEVPDFIWVFDDGIDEATKPDGGVIEDKDEIGPQEQIDSDENNDFEVAGALVECDTKEDCESLMCVVANDGKRYCAPFCPDGECPEGWECYELTLSRPGDTKVCLPRATYLCRPCMNNEDCAPYGAKSKLDCVMLGNTGRFCLPGCGNCPQGYFCSQVMQDHCVPESGACECIAEFISGAYETVCYVENEYGRCEGKAKCTEDGLLACSASTPAPEQCNRIDDDCDGETDEEGASGCTNFYKDEDKDSFGTSDFRCLCSAYEPFVALKDGDCDDSNAQVNQGAQEICENRIDDNCNGETDENCGMCTLYYRDEDGDGYGVTGDKQCLLAPIPPYRATQGGDCDDKDPNVNPSSVELCNQKDDDCDGQTDEDFPQKGAPCDGNDMDFCKEGVFVCKAHGFGVECNDRTDDRKEVCNNGLDDDCDGLTDENEENALGCITYYLDYDGDSYGGSRSKCLCAPDPQSKYTAIRTGDCNDNDAHVYPDAPELCNFVDDDCDQQTDEDFPTKGQPCDGADSDLCKEGQYVCNADGTGVQCNDNTGNNVELCNNLDDDCDGLTDEDFPQKGEPCDGDDKDFCMEGVYVCSADGTALYCTDTTGDDPEICNNIDDDCDGVTDNGSSLCPPASFSLCDGDVLVSHSGQGTCVAGTCSYPIVSKELCAWGCESGQCKPCSPSCAGVLCGDDGCGGSCGQCPDGAPLNPAHNQVLNILGRFWMPNFGDGDHMTTTNPDENPGGTFEGQMFYVPAGNASGTHALFRLLASNDHMDSAQAGEGGYTTEFILGYPFDSPNLGLCEIRRWFSQAQTDHMTAFCNEDAGAQGYQKEGVLGYGFPRHGNNCEVPIAVAGSGVTIVSNLAAGGAISELWWNGKQFINDYDYGRQVQIAFNQALPGETDNPTEGGDKWGCPGARPAGWAHGSIVLSYSVEQGRLTTLTSPLQWSPENFGGGRNNPVRWLGTIGKTVELDFAQIPHAIKWTTTITFPGGANFLDLEIVTAYLNSEFNRFYAYDAFQQSLADMTSNVPNGGCLDPSQDARLRPIAGGVIISTSDGAYALGVYRRYGRNNFGLCKFLGSGGTGKYGFQTTKWNVLQRQPNGISPGTHSFTVYLVVGTLQDAVSTMRTLFERGH